MKNEFDDLKTDIRSVINDMRAALVDKDWSDKFMSFMGGLTYVCVVSWPILVTCLLIKVVFFL